MLHHAFVTYSQGLRESIIYCKHILSLSSSASQYSLRGVGATSVDVDDLLGGAIVPDSPKTAAALIAALVKEE